MEREQAERFAAAAERDYLAVVRVYDALVTGPVGLSLAEVGEARAHVLAAQQVRELARLELRWSQQDERERVAAAPVESQGEGRG